MDRSAQIALLIDADNATARRIDVILGELSTLGETNIRRAYGNWTKAGLKSWQAVLHEHAIRPMQEFDRSRGKNASDIALAVDAVQILHTQRPDAFALVSSDADFTPLVMHLREHGARVYGFGDAKTPEPFQSACTRFLVLDRLDSSGPSADAAPFGGEQATDGGPAASPSAGASKAADRGTAKKGPGRKAAAPAAAPQQGRASRAQLRGDQRLVALLRRAVDGAADESGWASVNTVGQRIANQSSFDPRNYGYGKLSKLLEATDLFEIRGVGSPAMAVRDRRTSGGSPT
jgi:uncharacterized LabA/DUF88 family protein